MTRKTRGPGARSVAMLTIWMTGCAVGIVALWSLDGPRTSLPPTNTSEIEDWVTTGGALDTFASFGRLAATIALAYLLLVAVLHVVVSAWGSAHLRRRVGRLNPAPVAALVTLAVAGAGPMSAGASTSPQHGDGATMVLVEDEPPTMSLRERPTLRDRPTRPGPPARVDSADIDVADDGKLVDEVPVGTPDDETPDDDVVGDEVTGTPSTIVVRPGDHLWGIAEDRVGLALGDRATEADVRSYWTALIDANADRLVEPGNADLIVPGQDLVLPG